MADLSINEIARITKGKVYNTDKPMEDRISDIGGLSVDARTAKARELSIAQRLLDLGP